METAETYNRIYPVPEPYAGERQEGDRMVNVQKAGEVYRCNVCGNVVLVSEAGGGELVCHGEPMQLVAVQESQSG